MISLYALKQDKMTIIWNNNYWRDVFPRSNSYDYCYCWYTRWFHCFVVPPVVYRRKPACCFHSYKHINTGTMNNRKAMYLPILYSSLKQERNNRVSNLLQVLEDKKQATEQNSLVLVKEWIWLVLFGFISIAVMISFYVVTRNRRLSILLAAYGLLWSISIVVQRLQLHRMYLTQVGWQQYADKRIWELKEDVKEYENQLATLSSQLESLIKTCQSLERKQEERREEWKHFLWEWKRWKEEWNESRVAVQIRLYQLDKWEERWTSLQSSLQELTNYHLTERRNWSEISQQLQTLSKQMNLQVSGENLPKSTDRNNVSGIVPWKQGGGEYNQLYSFSRDEFEREELLSQLDEEWMDAYWKERDSISPLLLESSKTISQLPQGMEEEEEEGGKNKPIASIERLLSEEEKPLLSKQDEEAFKKETLILMEQIGIVEKSQVGRIIESTVSTFFSFLIK